MPKIDWNGLDCCPRHGHPFSLVAAGVPFDLGTQVRVVASCPECRYDWIIHITLSQDRDYVAPAGSLPRGHRCGTVAGYRQHQERGEAPCVACERAHTKFKLEAALRKRRERSSPTNQRRQ
jgi:hypothetical protein